MLDLCFYLRSVYVTQIQSRAGVATKPCTCSAHIIFSVQIIATSNTTDLPPNSGLVGEISLFQGNLSW